MRRIYSLCILLLLTLCAAPYADTAHAAQSGQSAPQFTWSSFLRFWNKSATPLVQLDKAVRHGEDYVVDYGYTTTVHIHIQKQQVVGVSLYFVGGGNNDSGGPQFLRLINHCIAIGTYQWPSDKILEARTAFANMRPDTVEYAFGYARFVRTYTQETGWEFRLEFLQNRP